MAKCTNKKGVVPSKNAEGVLGKWARERRESLREQRSRMEAPLFKRI